MEFRRNIMAITNKTVLLKGSKDTENVKILQKYLGIVIDGDFGPKTEQAVRDYQKKNELYVDGIAGPKTLTKMGLLKTTVSTKPQATYNSDKSEILKQIAVAIGGKFNTFTEFYNLIRKNEDYAFYIGDKKNQKEAIESLQKNTGLNCVDFSQIGAAVINELNKIANKGYQYRYVRTFCKIEKVGHIYLEAKGAELGSTYKSCDLAAAASNGSQYNIGKAWCQSWPDKKYNHIIF